MFYGFVFSYKDDFAVYGVKQDKSLQVEIKSSGFDSDKNTHQESKLKKMNVLCIFCLPNFQFPSTSTCNVFKHLSLMQLLQTHFRSILFFLLKADLMQTGVLEWPEFLSLMSQSGRLRYFQMVHVSNIWLEIMVNLDFS